FVPELSAALTVAALQLVASPVAQSPRALRLHLYAREDRQALGEAPGGVQLAPVVDDRLLRARRDEAESAPRLGDVLLILYLAPQLQSAPRRRHRLFESALTDQSLREEAVVLREADVPGGHPHLYRLAQVRLG